MSDHSNGVLSVILGSIAGISIGGLLFQALGVLLLGVIGAAGGWIFEKLIKPKLNKFIPKDNKEA
jgi:uncharacterized protein (DUF58 family)